MADSDGITRPHQAQSEAHRENPYLKFTERSSYELGDLLRNLPARGRSRSMTEDDRQMAKAAAQHAANGISTLLYGLEAIGGLMVDVGMEPEYEMESGRVLGLGSLIQHLAVEVQFLQETRSGLLEDLRTSQLEQKGGA
jgi:hypothetical protein